MSEMHEPSADDLIARHFSGRFVLHDGGMWFDLHAAQEVVEFCASQGIAVVRMVAEWDWPEGRQHAMYDNLQRSLTWREIVQECAEYAQMYFQTGWRKRLDLPSPSRSSPKRPGKSITSEPRG